jgi:hypothetical protein
MSQIAEHTPVPWRPTDVGSVRSVAPDDVGGLVAVVYPLVVDDRATMAANARLIAAAPDLLAFARRSLPMLIAERDCLYDGCTNAEGEYRDDEDRMAVEQTDREINDLRALIARAEGTA